MRVASLHTDWAGSSDTCLVILELRRTGAAPSVDELRQRLHKRIDVRAPLLTATLNALSGLPYIALLLRAGNATGQAC